MEKVCQEMNGMVKKNATLNLSTSVLEQVAW